MMLVVGYDYCSKESHVVGHLSTSKRSNPTPQTKKQKKRGEGEGEGEGQKIEDERTTKFESPFGAGG
jgi:hypothetical protein